MADVSRHGNIDDWIELGSACCSRSCVCGSVRLCVYGYAGGCWFRHGRDLPARDLMIRRIVPPGDSGKVFGFIFVGYSIGGSLAPLLYGRLLDLAQPAMVFQVSAGFALLALAAVALASLVSPRSLNELAPPSRGITS